MFINTYTNIFSRAGAVGIVCIAWSTAGLTPLGDLFLKACFFCLKYANTSMNIIIIVIKATSAPVDEPAVTVEVVWWWSVGPVYTSKWENRVLYK